MTNPSFRFTTCSKSLVPEAVVTIDASHVISLLDPGEPLERPSRISAVNHLRLNVRDVSDPLDIGAPSRDQVEALLLFGQRLPPGGGVGDRQAGIDHVPDVEALLPPGVIGPGAGRGEVIRPLPEGFQFRNPLLEALFVSADSDVGFHDLVQFLVQREGVFAGLGIVLEGELEVGKALLDVGVVGHVYADSAAILAPGIGIFVVLGLLFAWLGLSRRLSKDYEVLPEVSEAMVQLSAIRLMVRRLG